MTRRQRVGPALRRGAAWGAVALAAALLLLAAPAEERKPSLPADLELVPRDAAGFLSVRVGSLWNDPHFQKLRNQIAQQDREFVRDIEKNVAVGVDLGQVERLTVVLPKFPGPNSEGVVFLLLVTTTKPYDKGQVLAAVLPESKETKVGGKTVHVGGDAALAVIDERSYVMGPTPAVQALLEKTDRPADGPLSAALVQAAGTHQATVGINFAPLRALVAQADENDPGAALFKPIFQAKGGTATLDVTRGTTLAGRLNFANKNDAEEGARGVKAIAGLIAAALPQLEQELKRAEIKSEPAAQFFKEIVEVFKTPPVQTKGETVQVEVKLKADMASLAGAMYDVLVRARAQAEKMTAANNLKQIALALHNYHDTNGHLPPVAICDKQGKPLLSWRVAILPYIEQDNLYRQFKLDEPWDSENNRALSSVLIKVFTSPGKADGPKTHYRVFYGNGAAFDKEKQIKLQDFTDGTSNTLLVVEASEAVEWAKPDELAYDPKKELPKLGIEPKGFHAALGDGSVRFISKDIDKKQLHALITRNGGEMSQD